VKGAVLLFVILVLAALAYRFATTPASVTTTFPNEISSQMTPTLVSSTSSVTSATSVISSATAPPVTLRLSPDDFNMTSGDACESVNQTLLLVTLYISNRFNFTVHFINETTAGSMIAVNSTNQAVPIDLGEAFQGHPHFIKVQPIIMTVRLDVVPQGDTPVQLTFDVTAYVAEVSGPISLSTTVDLQRTFSICSLA